MKKIFALAVGVSLATLSGANATVIRVNNTPGSAAPYTTIQAAHDAASPNDTLYVESSATSYGGLTATKPLVYIGPGYFLNGNQQVNTNTAQLSTVFLNAGSQGSKMMGLHLGGVYVSANNMLFKRNYSMSLTLGYNGPVSDIMVSQCYETSVGYSGYAIANVIINNSYLTQVNLQFGSTTGVLVYNNVINGGIYLRNAAFYNNILRGSASFGTLENSTISYNMATGNQLNPASIGSNSFGNNIHNIAVDTDVFLPSAGNPNDRRWQLQANGNAAIGSGINGEDLGMYGGNQPYVISGIPAIPAVYFLNTSGVGNNTVPLNVTTKVRSHN